ncbi:MAG: hypothetical protein K2M73_09850 [Lachnospiraceae bacterium]|nr:hypothetical protein [Lachnospiraceae bacterium]
MKSRLKFLIVISVLCILAVVLYYHFSNSMAASKKEDGTDNTEVREIDKLLTKDLESGYPITVREVVNLYTRIQMCYYNEDLTSEELVKLAYMATAIFDDELVSNNSFDEYYSELLTEIDQYMEEGRTISRIIIDKSSDVIYSTVEGEKYASINCIYYLKTDKGTEKTTETYVLRKDSNDRWKILGWKLYEEDDD